MPFAVDQVIEAMFKEYTTLRDEVLQSITHRTQIISFGLGAIATFVAGTLVASLNEQSPDTLVVIFSVVVPAASLLLLYVWLAELARMFRASNYLVGVEERINARIGIEALRWEQHLAAEAGKKRFRFHLVVVALFTSVAIASPFLGIGISDEATWGQRKLWAIGAVASVVAALHVGFWSNRMARGDDRTLFDLIFRSNRPSQPDVV